MFVGRTRISILLHLEFFHDAVTQISSHADSRDQVTNEALLANASRDTFVVVARVFGASRVFALFVIAAINVTSAGAELPHFVLGALFSCLEKKSC